MINLTADGFNDLMAQRRAREAAEAQKKGPTPLTDQLGFDFVMPSRDDFIFVNLTAAGARAIVARRRAREAAEAAEKADKKSPG
jgi:hypothetical protein